MILSFNHNASDRHRSFQCEALNVYWHNDNLAAIEIAGPVTAIRACWSEVVRARSSRTEREVTGLRVETGGDVIDISVLTANRFIKTQIPGNKNQIVLLEKGFGYTQRTMFFGGDYENPSEYFLDALRMNLSTIPFLAEWGPQLWHHGIENKVIQPLLHHGKGPEAWAIVSNTEIWQKCLERAVKWLN